MSHRKRRWLGHGNPGGTPPPPPIRMWAPGFIASFLRQSLFSGPGGSYSGIPNPGQVGPNTPFPAGTTACNCPHDWNELEPNGMTDPVGVRFDFSRVQSELDDVAARSLVAGYSIKYILRIIVKSFRGLGTNPLPLDMQQPAPNNRNNPDGFASFFQNQLGGVGYGTWRHDPVYITRFAFLIQKLGAQFKDHPNFHGISTQETALGWDTTPANDPYSQYSPEAYKTNWIAEVAAISNASPNWRAFPLINFMAMDGAAAGIPKTAAQAAIYLAQGAAAVQQYGAVLAFPDMCTDLASGGVVDRVYDIHAAYGTAGTVTRSGTNPTTVTMPMKAPTGGSIQRAEWIGIPPADPLYGPTGNKTVCIEDLYNWWTQSHTYTVAGGFPNTRDHRIGSSSPGMFTLDYLFMEYNNAGVGQNFKPDGANMITAHPQFGNFVPTF